MANLLLRGAETLVTLNGNYTNKHLDTRNVTVGLNPDIVIQAMIEIAKQMGWKYVSTVAAEGEYGEKGIASFVALAKRQGICIAVSTKARSNEAEEL